MSALAGPLLVLAALAAGADDAQTAPLRIESVLLELVEQVDVPARDAGVLQSIQVHEGQLVGKGELLGKLESHEAELAHQRAKIEWEIARRQAENDVGVRFAKKSLEVARAELRRATESVEDYPKSISQTEIDRLRLTVDRSELEVEQTSLDLELAGLTAQLKENTFRKAEHQLERLSIHAPLDGVVAQVYRCPGEWVEPGSQILRIVRMDKLRGEGFLDAAQIRGDLVGRRVKLEVHQTAASRTTFAGRIVFVSPEIDPVNGQTRIWAEIDNRDLSLHPGLQATMVIDPVSSQP